MTTLVTGAGGYIGSHALYALQSIGERVVALDNLSRGVRAAVPSTIPLVVGDVQDQNLVRRVVKEYSVDAVMHFAAFVDVAESVENQSLYIQNNTDASEVLFCTVAEAGVPYIIFSSTAAVYGDRAENPVDESAELNPVSPYAVSKQWAERLLEACAAARPGITYATLRYFNVAGADRMLRTGNRSKHPTHLIARACLAALGEIPYLGVFGTDYPTPDGTAVRDYVHVTDLVVAHVKVLQYLRAGGASVVLNCGYGSGYSVRNVIDALERVSGRRLDARAAPRRAGDVAAVVADARKIRAVLGWEPKYESIDSIIADELLWQRHFRRQLVA